MGTRSRMTADDRKQELLELFFQRWKEWRDAPSPEAVKRLHEIANKLEEENENG